MTLKDLVNAVYSVGGTMDSKISIIGKVTFQECGNRLIIEHDQPNIHKTMTPNHDEVQIILKTNHTMLIPISI